jgi:hypothetical protein
VLDEVGKRGQVETPVCTQKPSTYVRSGRVYFHAEDYEPLLGATASYLSPEVLYYASDRPHWDTEFPANITQLSQRQDLSPADKRWLLAATAKKLYKLNA